tara:strand:+ start:70 stop:453 length:384 start_codon:yes stop_codon:yes gene_type:complete
MKSSSNLKKLKKQSKEISETISQYCDKIKKDYKKILIAEKNDLISRIAEGEKLDEMYLKEKYSNTVKKKKNKLEIEESSEELLHKVIINGETYYHEPKLDGIIYNVDSEQVGIKKEGNFPKSLNMTI